MLTRAYATFHVKSVDTRQRIIEGIASTPTIDRGGDSMDPLGAKFSLPLPFLWFHRSDEPIGEVFEAIPRSDGIHIKARVSRVTIPGRLKTLVDEAWSAFTASPPLVRGLSIGWSPITEAPIPGVKGARRVSEWLWGELSAVTIPMNVEATITAIKSLDTSRGTASGPYRTTILPGVSGLQSQASAMRNASEQLTEQQTLLQTKTARFAELEAASETDGGLDTADQTERTTLQTEIAELTGKVQRLKTIEQAQMAMAAPMATPTSRTIQPTPPTQTRVEVVNLPKGTRFTRVALATAAGRGSHSDTLAYARRWDGQTPEVSAYIKAMWGHKADPGTSVVGSPAWGGELVNPSTIATEFVELLRAETIIGRVNGFRMTPFNIPIITQTAGSTFGWVGESDPKPVGELAFTRTTLPYHKVAGIVVLTEELVRLSTPNAEDSARRDLIEQCARFIDEAFIQVAKSAGADNPASITNGVSSPSASGTTLAALMADLNTALGTLTAANIPLDGLAIVTTPEVALRLSLMTTSLGTTPSGISMTPSGGTLLGYQVVVSNSVDADTLVIFKPSEIFLADDGGVTVDASNQATLDMAGSTSPTFSLWQRNCVGLRAERWITWAKRRSTVVAIIDTIAYVPGT